ncbi:uncharacterized protein TNCV_423181 [Trichonephila clavipes]|nr:uncharacterized protein TNCV_423181 [Trichonephila clavipes]
MLNLNIAYPPTPTRFGYNSANTIDIALIKNFYYPFCINSIDDLSSDHSPVFTNFSFKLVLSSPNPRAVSTGLIQNPSLNCKLVRQSQISKANLLATNLKNNFIENEHENDSYNHNDENINSTVNNFLSTPPTTNIEPALPDEIVHYIKHVNSKKAPGRTLIAIENKALLYTAVMRPILAYASPVWGYAAKTNINKLDTLQNSLIRMIVKATRYMRNDDIRKDLKINSFKAYIQNNAINFFTNLDLINNVNIQNLIPYTPNDNTKRPRRILLDSYNPP